MELISLVASPPLAATARDDTTDGSAPNCEEATPQRCPPFHTSAKIKTSIRDGELYHLIYRTCRKSDIK